nr:MAG TPA: hypothetical protein [Caudoviricetes sp.]
MGQESNLRYGAPRRGSPPLPTAGIRTTSFTAKIQIKMI